MPKTVILSAARTPIGKLGGGLTSLDATELGGTAISAALERAEVAPEQVEHVVMGQVLQAGQGQIPSRQAQIKAGIPKEVSSETINKVCASGVRAAAMLDAAIRAGDLEVAVAGGMESMSNAPYLLKEARFGYRMGDAKALDAMVHDGLTNPFSGRQMFAGGHRGRRRARAHAPGHGSLGAALASAARQGDRRGPPGRGDRAGDGEGQEGRRPRSRSTRGRAARRRWSSWPSCGRRSARTGSHTAGNSPGVNDGAGALVLASDEWAKRNDRAALATVIAQAQVADDFAYLARTPANAAEQGAGEGGAEGRGRRPLGDQRGVCLGRR